MYFTWDFDLTLPDKDAVYAVVFSTDNISGSIVSSERLQMFAADMYAGGEILQSSSPASVFEVEFIAELRDQSIIGTVIYIF